MSNILDVAKVAKFSVSTVSRVLNDHPYVTEEKREAVKEAIKQTGYIKNINAVNLQKGKTHLIGVVIPFLNHPYFSKLIQGISQSASIHGYTLVLFQTGYHEDQEVEALEMLKHKQIDNLIICSRKISLKTVEGYLKYGKIVLFENGGETALSYAFIDHYSSFKIALEYLYQKGHIDIGICLNRLEGTNAKQRELAYRHFLKEKKLDNKQTFIFNNCLYLEDGERVLKELTSSEKRPTALLTTSDQVATGVIISSSKFGIDIPTDLALIGFDNQPIARAMNITTVDIPIHLIGQFLFEQGLSEEVLHKEFSSELIERGTV